MEAAVRVSDAAVQGAAASRSTRPVMTSPPLPGAGRDAGVGGAVHVYATGFLASPYADILPAGDATTRGRGAPRRLWHSSSGSSGG